MVHRVLVGVDFSEASRQALARAGQWAIQLGVPLVAMHVVEVPVYPADMPYASLGDPAWFEKAGPNSERLLRTWVEPYPGATALVRTGGAAAELMAEADADTLLVVGQVGHSALAHALFGSTASKVTRHAPCDVLVVRSQAKG